MRPSPGPVASSSPGTIPPAPPPISGTDPRAPGRTLICPQSCGPVAGPRTPPPKGPFPQGEDRPVHQQARHHVGSSGLHLSIFTGRRTGVRTARHRVLPRRPLRAQRRRRGRLRRPRRLAARRGHQDRRVRHRRHQPRNGITEVTSFKDLMDLDPETVERPGAKLQAALAAAQRETDEIAREAVRRAAANAECPPSQQAAGPWHRHCGRRAPVEDRHREGGAVSVRAPSLSADATLPRLARRLSARTCTTSSASISGWAPRRFAATTSRSSRPGLHRPGRLAGRSPLALATDHF